MMDEENDMREKSGMREDDDFWEFASTSFQTRRRGILCAITTSLLLLVVMIASTSKTRKPNESQIPTYATVAEEKKELFEMIEDALLSLSLPTDNLLLTKSYQYKAFDWLSENTNLEGYDDSRKLQRFAMACFYYSTFQVTTKHTPEPSPWVYQEYWLTDKHECDWAGIHCTASKRVHSISLEKNNLTGKLPLELTLLKDTLMGLDLSTNSIDMTIDDMNIFGMLPRLEKLLLDDNYLESRQGLPQSLQKCTDLRKLKLSYNLLEGPLDNGILNNLQKLTHLEIESNFLTGALPFLGEMAELEHVYLRRNNLNAHLNFIKSPASRNIKELWLDGNPISQTIPSQIGMLTQLESFSIANAKLTGTLPSEMGNMTALRRVWLSNNGLSGSVPSELSRLSSLELLKLQDNDLTGTIPENVCSIVSSSEFEHKTIMADCDNVQCSCCNECGS
jgi:hypothetical protein